MKRILIFFLLANCFRIDSQILWQINKDTVITYYYTDGDEFNGDEILNEKWKSWFGWARSIFSNKEQQYYTEFKNHELKNGTLFLNANKKEVDARLVDWMGDNDTIKHGDGKFNGLNKRKFKYTSGMISSKNEFLKGYFEIKFKAPFDKGLWPAFWLYGGSPNEEIDIMELKGEKNKEIHVDTHCDNCDIVRNAIGQKKSFGSWIKLNEPLNEGFNVVSGLWDDNEVRYYLNGQCIAISKVKFNKPKHLVVNVAVAHNKGPFNPGPNENKIMFSPMEIDYVRVWTKDEKQIKKKLIDTLNKANKINNSRMKKPVKMAYGSKKEHINDGVFVSAFKNKEDKVVVFCNGLNKNQYIHVKLTSLYEAVLFDGDVNQPELEIPIQVGNGSKLEVTFQGKTIQYFFFR